MTDNDLITGRITKLLGNIDKLAGGIREQQERQQRRVRDARGRERLNGYRACQYLDIASRGLAALRDSLFTDPAVNYNGPNGEVDTEQNEELMCMRLHDSAGNLGITFLDAGDAVLEALETQCHSVQTAFNEALLWAVAS